jgi:hypothetical protein
MVRDTNHRREGTNYSGEKPRTYSGVKTRTIASVLQPSIFKPKYLQPKTFNLKPST